MQSTTPAEPGPARRPGRHPARERHEAREGGVPGPPLDEAARALVDIPLRRCLSRRPTERELLRSSPCRS